MFCHLNIAYNCSFKLKKQVTHPVIIRRYLTREVMQTTLVVMSVLLLAFLSQQLVRYMNYVAVGKIATNVLFQLVSFEVPYLMALLLPLALYLGILLAYGRLYTDNEMAILQMSGFGERRVMGVTAALALMVSVFILMLMTLVNPWVSLKRQALMNSDEATLHLIQTLIPGRFQVTADGKRVMYVEKLSMDRTRAQNVFMAEQRVSPGDPETTRWMLVSAELGYQEKVPNSQDPYFVTTDGYRYEGTPGDNAFKVTQFKKYAVRIPEASPRMNHVEDETLPTSVLFQERANPNRAGELQWRFSIAISAFVLALLAVPLSTIKPRSGRFLVLLPAVLVYIIYINLLFMARHSLETGAVPLWVGMWWVHGVMLLAVLAVLWHRSKQWV
jgi:lipopolysaccharide export system permease protein